MTDNIALIAGYLVVVFVVAQWALVVRERKGSLLVLHTVAMAAVVGAWANKGYAYPAIFNAVWLVAALVWYAAARPKRPATR